MVLGSPTEETEALVKFSNHGGRTKVNLGLAGFKASAYLFIWLHWSLCVMASVRGEQLQGLMLSL